MTDIIYMLLLEITWFQKLAVKIASGMMDQALGVGQLTDIGKALHMNDPTYNTYWNVVNGAINIVMPFGLALITTYFIMFLMESAAREQITADALIKVLIQLVITVALVSNLDLIINAILSIAESIFNQVLGYFTLDDPPITGKEILEAWAENGDDAAGTIIFQAFFIWTVHQIAVIAVYFAMFSRMIELGWKIVFAPIGIANNFEGGANSAGIRYLKGIAGTALAGAAIIIVCAVGFSVSAAMLMGKDALVLAAMGAQLATAGAAIGISGKIRDVVN